MTSAAFEDEQITCCVECSIIVVSTLLLVTKLLLGETSFIIWEATTNIVFVVFLALYGWSNHPNGVNMIFYKNKETSDPPPNVAWSPYHRK